MESNYIQHWMMQSLSQWHKTIDEKSWHAAAKVRLEAEVRIFTNGATLIDLSLVCYYNTLVLFTPLETFKADDHLRICTLWSSSNSVRDFESLQTKIILQGIGDGHISGPAASSLLSKIIFDEIIKFEKNEPGMFPSVKLQRWMAQRMLDNGWECGK